MHTKNRQNDANYVDDGYCICTQNLIIIDLIKKNNLLINKIKIIYKELIEK